ncbi:hypothetical protein QQ008_19545 [Fulvivirgaceae bacterium BMA10]|uniref:Uncharacterized protein n=1 Tax=Splendidivirga corallicola TaxID=3051826 RepID=A0ABT8KS46_9BACT|nr:hypothetical protein [Fulvivirgaceae bacterium BMA10]
MEDKTNLNFLIATLNESKGDNEKQFEIVIDILQYHYLDEDGEMDVTRKIVGKIIRMLSIVEIRSRQDLKTYVNEIVYNG